MRAYSMDLRVRVWADLDAGLKTRAVATGHTVSESWVRRRAQTRRDAGRVAPATRRPAPPGWAAHADDIRAAVAAAPDATLREHRQRLGLGLSVPTLAQAPVALGLSRKRSRFGRPTRTART